MKIKKKVQGYDVILDYKRVKTYPHGYTLYNVYKMLGKAKRKFLYKTCLTDLQIKEIVLAGYVVNEEAFN